MQSQLQIDDPRQRALNRMKWLATGLLVGVALLFVVARLLERQYAWVGFVRAFAEAAMVGALADWFAVTALFRHPLGLRIPHTAIIPRRKDSIGASIGRFVADNFLSEDVLVGRLRAQRVVERAAAALSQTDLNSQVARHVATALNNALRVVNDADVQALIEHSVVSRVRSVHPAPLVGRTLAVVLGGRRQTELAYELANLTAHLLEENKAAIRLKI